MGLWSTIQAGACLATLDAELTYSPEGQEAIERFPRSSYDVILCALRMPAMNGPAFYREIQSRYPGAGLQIIFMIAHAELHEHAPFLTDVGATILRKPFSIEELRLAIASPGRAS